MNVTSFTDTRVGTRDGASNQVATRQVFGKELNFRKKMRQHLQGHVGSTQVNNRCSDGSKGQQTLLSVYQEIRKGIGRSHRGVKPQILRNGSERRSVLTFDVVRPPRGTARCCSARTGGCTGCTAIAPPDFRSPSKPGKEGGQGKRTRRDTPGEGEARAVSQQGASRARAEATKSLKV